MRILLLLRRQEINLVQWAVISTPGRVSNISRAEKVKSKMSRIVLSLNCDKEGVGEEREEAWGKVSDGFLVLE